MTLHTWPGGSSMLGPLEEVKLLSQPIDNGLLVGSC